MGLISHKHAHTHVVALCTVLQVKSMVDSQLAQAGVGSHSGAEMGGGSSGGGRGAGQRSGPHDPAGDLDWSYITPRIAGTPGLVVESCPSV